MKVTILKLAVVVFAGALPMSARAAPVCSAKAVGVPRTIAPGIVLQPYAVSCRQTTQGGPPVDPAGVNMHRVTVDLTTPRLSVRTSVPAPASGTPAPGKGAVFAVAPVSAVFPDAGLSPTAGAPVPQIAINAHLFTNCCTTVVPPPADKALTLLRGLETSDGTVFVPPRANAAGTGIPYATFASSLVIDRYNHGAIWTAGQGTAVPGGSVTAVTGSHRIADGGRNLVPACSDTNPCAPRTWLGPNARTGVGLIGRSTLVMIVADGIDNQQGLTLYQFGDLFAQMATTAINLDGGGSSTMVARDDAGGFTILNTLQGPPRDVGAILYVTAPD